MTSAPSMWFSASRPWPDALARRRDTPAGPRLGQLGLGAQHWPGATVSHATRRRVEEAFDWFPVETLTGPEWCRLCPSRGVADHFAAEALANGSKLVVLRYDLETAGDCLGWDIGPPAGGHSAIPHEVPMLTDVFDTRQLLNENGLFWTHAAALAFWKHRGRLANAEEPGGWAIVRVSVAAAEGGVVT